jgi:hypothetical protein
MNREHGQILPLGLVFILVMTLFWVMVINIGMLIKSRIQLQIAADTAAQSACAIKARALSSIGRMNSWLGTPAAGIGIPKTAWWPDAAPAQKRFINLVIQLQESYDRTYGGVEAARRVHQIAQAQGADGIYTPPKAYSLHLQRNVGPIWYLSTRHVIVEGYPIPYPAEPKIMDDAPGTKRWYQQGPDFAHNSLRLYAYRRSNSPFNASFPLGQKLLKIHMPDLYAVAAARVYNTKGPMFPRASETEGFTGGLKAMKAYQQASEHWRSQLVPMGSLYEH